MASAKQVAALTLYANIMEEVKARLTAIEQVMNGHSALTGQIAKELCFLQLRMICELIALGCLTAHGDLGKVELGRLKKEYSADKIISQLGDLTPNCYPIPYTQAHPTPNYFHITDVTSSHLTKAELLVLYRKCGDVVHRGSIKRLMSRPMSENVQFPAVAEWVEKIGALLKQHRVALLDGEMQLLCYLSSADNNNRCYVVVAEHDKSLSRS